MYEKFDAEQSSAHLQDLRNMVANIRGESVQTEKEEEAKRAPKIIRNPLSKEMSL